MAMMAIVSLYDYQPEPREESNKVGSIGNLENKTLMLMLYSALAIGIVALLRSIKQ